MMKKMVMSRQVVIIIRNIENVEDENSNERECRDDDNTDDDDVHDNVDDDEDD